MDGGEQIGAAAGRVLRDRLFSRERDLSRFDLGALWSTFAVAAIHARSFNDHALPFRIGRGRCAYEPAARPRNLHRLLDRLFAARAVVGKETFDLTQNGTLFSRFEMPSCEIWHVGEKRILLHTVTRPASVGLGRLIKLCGSGTALHWGGGPFRLCGLRANASGLLRMRDPAIWAGGNRLSGCSGNASFLMSVAIGEPAGRTINFDGPEFGIRDSDQNGYVAQLRRAQVLTRRIIDFC